MICRFSQAHQDVACRILLDGLARLCSSSLSSLFRRWRFDGRVRTAWSIFNDCLLMLRQCFAVYLSLGGSHVAVFDDFLLGWQIL